MKKVRPSSSKLVIRELNFGASDLALVRAKFMFRVLGFNTPVSYTHLTLPTILLV